MPDFMICYTEHELKYVVVTADSEEEARRMFDDGNVEWDAARGYGDYAEPTFNSIERIA